MGRPRLFESAQVLDSAVSRFIVSGYNGTSTRDLVAATGLGQQSLYNAFGDKKAFYIASLEHYFTTSIEPLLSPLESRISELKGIVRFFSGYIDLISSDQTRRGCFFVNAAAEMMCLDRDIEELLSRIQDRIESAFCHTIDRAVEMGELRNIGSTLALSQDLVSVMFGLSMSARCGASREHLVNVVSIALQPLY